MTDDEITDICNECGIWGLGNEPGPLHKIARLIEQRTIERCAEVCEKTELEYEGVDQREACAAAIRSLLDQPSRDD